LKKYRLERLNETIKREISEIVFKEVKDPRIKGLVTFTEVDVSPDLRQAKVYVSIFGLSEEESKKVIAGLKSAESFIKYRVSKNLRLKYTPDLIFIKDDTIERGSRIVEKLEHLKKEEEKNDTK